MSKNRKSGLINVGLGPTSHNWKGGVSSINVITRVNKRLYTEWKYPILVRDGFKCTQCSKSTDLHVHHDKETMSEIIKKHMVDGIDVVDFEFKRIIMEKVIDYHVNNKVSGITVCNECHEKYHPSLNFK